MGIFDRMRGENIRVNIIIKGRVADQWIDVTEALRVPKGTTVQRLIEAADAANVPFSWALENSPHLAETMMLNGERCPVVDHTTTVLNDGDQISLLAPLAGG